MKDSPQQNHPYVFQHLGAIFFNRVQELGERPFLKFQSETRFEEISWKDFGSKVRETILGLYSLGLQKGDRVGILSENRLEWFCADTATMAGGLPNVVISPLLSDRMILKALGHSGARAVFVENKHSLDRLQRLKGQLPCLANSIVMEKQDSLPPDTLTHDGLQSRGRTVDERRFQEILASVRPDDIASIMYTSGSTGEPKGVMRTQENMRSNILGEVECLPCKPEEIFLVVLSLSHLLGRFGFHKSMVTGRTMAFVQVTEGNVDLKIIQALSPTIMTLVPRVTEKILKTILAEGKNQQHWEAIEALDQAKAMRGTVTANEDQQYEEMRLSLMDSVKFLLGGRIEFITYGGAPMPPRIIRFFEVIRLPLVGSYGTTECGGISISGMGDFRPGSAGKPFPNVELSIAEDGEILVRGPAVFPGYFENPQATREALDPDGWNHTGDLGKIDPDGYLFLVGRKKDVFNCSDGSNIYPGFIELLLEQDSLIRQAALVGDRRPFIAALIVPDRGRIATELDKEESSLTDDDIQRILWHRVEMINEGLEHYEQIRKMTVLKGEFSERVRSITAFQKVKVDRRELGEIYRREIEEIYSRSFE